MRRVLVVPTTPLGHEGITNVILNYFRNIDRQKFKFDFVISTGAMVWVKNEITSLNGNIYYLPSRNKKPIQYLINLTKIMKKNNYHVVHVHGNSGTMALEMVAAKFANVPMRIAHSHNSTSKHKFVHHLLKPLLNRTITHGLSCSKMAGKWAFNRDFTIVKNGIDIEKYLYNENIRIEYRNKLGIQDKFVVGHIGHMSYQKNHEFLINVFYEIYNRNQNARLLLVGDGVNREIIEKQIEELSLKDAVLLLGRRSDVNKLLQAMDVFVLPSRYEGLGIVNIEAQAAGLKCVVSDAVPQEAKVSDNICFLSLDESKQIWANTINQYSRGYQRKNMYKEIQKHGYDNRKVVKKLETLYQESY